MLFDTHTHLNDPDLFLRAGELIVRAQEVGVTRFVVPGYDRESSLRAMELAAQHEAVFAVVGFHPQDAAAVGESDFADLEVWVRDEKVVGIGEIGLDYHYEEPAREVQADVFRRQIAIAKQVRKPIVIHDRDAHGDVVRILRDENAKEIGGIMHSFSGSSEMAAECLQLNFYLSFAGPITFKNAKRPREVAAQVPLDRLLIETDAPYLTPEPYRGKQNEPAHVRFVADKLAQLRQLPVEEIARVTYANAHRIFSIAGDVQ
ncbi:TatD family hydrolase [Sulfoacidibacillus thermotolerans]|uniref:Hydrolase TatD n=1 Tax=Sulfoacidibacillus thermotolerans TaxID=1765684 RepID=A0A2U3D8I0_SULT2|nr:TatD family hydrolase [Sulfoacidibacillus thermotolerans]PWI57587.1 hydrolase TatD [Sulfoacidibacillus thermotolerans]